MRQKHSSLKNTTGSLHQGSHAMRQGSRKMEFRLFPKTGDVDPSLMSFAIDPHKLFRCGLEDLRGLSNAAILGSHAERQLRGPRPLLVCIF